MIIVGLSRMLPLTSKQFRDVPGFISFVRNALSVIPQRSLQIRQQKWQRPTLSLLFYPFIISHARNTIAK